jgi:hypothetical protein
MDAEKLAAMFDQIQQDHLDLNSLLVVRNGSLVSELYVYPYSKEQAQDAGGYRHSERLYQRCSPNLVEPAAG